MMDVGVGTGKPLKAIIDRTPK
jgi:ubiquinone/menaquinone biosynthesis C-methylase UbiE